MTESLSVQSQQYHTHAVSSRSHPCRWLYSHYLVLYKLPSCGAQDAEVRCGSDFSDKPDIWRGVYCLFAKFAAASQQKMETFDFSWHCMLKKKVI